MRVLAQQKLQNIIDAAWYTKPGENMWTVVEGCSWIKYIGPEWWASPSRLGVYIEDETPDEFLASKGVSWIEGDSMGRVLGPTDECN